ncbi:Xaa-Pro peptidase family protein [Geomonas sp. RF6]|uniref:M24 family metallopeptidase n=1 Tax=Geomonas sp. RF6 TaxID=2897342 RepID=UPI001E50F573|nr:Xaa-Pro peptidase family protein [Geomonas sp. RF6]UFS71276.1 Xaa-Pro peptidase family protein [Geomonas sp. RF6]
MRLTPKTELEGRCRKVQAMMADAGLDALIVLQNADLFYFTGTIQCGTLYIPVAGEPLYLVRRDLVRARAESALSAVLPGNSMRDLPPLLNDYGLPHPKRIGMELDVVPVNFFQKYATLFKDAVISDASDIIRRARMIKSGYEIDLLREGGRQCDVVYRRAAEVIREGISELELAAELERAARLEGHQGYLRMRGFNAEIFMDQVLSGSESATPSFSNTPLGGAGLNPSFGQGATRKMLVRNEQVLVDFGACCDGYIVDQTRVFGIGSVPPRIAAAYADMLKVQELMLRLVAQRESCGDVYDACLSLAAELGYADSFMGLKTSQVSFIGHGVGIELDEYPFIAAGMHKMTFEPGMVFAFEPKAVFAEHGAVGIENTFLVTENGVERLTYSSEELVLL